MTNRELQDEEVEALVSIYGDELTHIQHLNHYSVTIQIPNSSKELIVEFDPYTKDYPAEVPPVFEVHAAAFSPNEARKLENRFKEDLEAMFEPGIVCLFQWIEHLRENIEEVVATSCEDVLDAVNAQIAGMGMERHSSPSKVEIERRNMQIFHSENTLVDRKSRFVAHCAAISSEEDRLQALDSILSDHKVANATHNIQAYRYTDKSGTLYEQYDDDGETGAGVKVLFYLQRANLMNVLVVVTRWYGGVHLGPDRFKLITQCAKELLESCGCGASEAQSAKRQTKKKESKGSRKKR